ncbi:MULTISPECIES: hypothetical protein [Polaromonas]|uniref:Uncharacterized protein n=1 Tax=Polaromonas aquatica TaxID=332657 RepID=A0ABW1U3F5_9BURK
MPLKQVEGAGMHDNKRFPDPAGPEASLQMLAAGDVDTFFSRHLGHIGSEGAELLPMAARWRPTVQGE